MSNPQVLTVRHLSKSFARQDGPLPVLDNISFDIHAGEIVCVLGPSGCGKSTLLNLLADLDIPTSGRIILPSNISIGYIPQRDLLLRWRTILQNICFGVELHGTLTSAEIQAAVRMAERYRIGNSLSQFPDVLSGGMRQVAAFIRGLLPNSDLLLMDEPFSAMDYDLRLVLEDDLKVLVRSSSRAVLLVTHNIEDAVAIADRIIVLRGQPALIVAELKVPLSQSYRTVSECRLAPEFGIHYQRVLSAFTCVPQTK